MRIVIETLPHEQQRYNTVGDWYIDPDGTWHIKVSRLNPYERYCPPWELCIALHELVEMILCQHNEIDQKAVDAFDTSWRPHHGIDEPGEDHAAPYFLEHQIASGFERLLAAQLGVNWNDYCARVDEVSTRPTRGESEDD